jgi:hypothetical protein
LKTEKRHGAHARERYLPLPDASHPTAPHQEVAMCGIPGGEQSFSYRKTHVHGFWRLRKKEKKNCPYNMPVYRVGYLNTINGKL